MSDELELELTKLIERHNEELKGKMIRVCQRHCKRMVREATMGVKKTRPESHPDIKSSLLPKSLKKREKARRNTTESSSDDSR